MKMISLPYYFGVELRKSSKIIGFLCLNLREMCIFAACIERYHKTDMGVVCAFFIPPMFAAIATKAERARHQP